MRRFFGRAARLAAFLGLWSAGTVAAKAQPTITNPVVLATNVAGVETGTQNTQFIFRASVAPSAGNGLVWVRVVIDPVDPANPEAGPINLNSGRTFAMVNKGGEWVAYVPGSSIGGVGLHNWSIIAQDTGTGGTFMNGIGAGPKPAGSVRISAGIVTLIPVDQNFNPDKRVTPGQPGGGLRVNPVDAGSEGDGGGSHIYTWRMRVTMSDGLIPQLFVRRTRQEWRDPRAAFDQIPPFATRWNAGVMLVLIAPDGVEHYAAMEPDPEAPSGLTQAGYYTMDAAHPNTLMHPTGGAFSGYFRYRMVPTQYQFNWGPLPGEGPFTNFGMLTQPDLIPALPLGWQIGQEVVARPFANEYAGFAGPDRATPNGNFAPPYPYYTNTAGRAGQWRFYYKVTPDLRPVDRPGFATNGNINTYPNDLYGADEGAYGVVYESDNGLSPGNVGTPYQHPLVTPILSDGGWSDDLPQNGYVNGIGGPAHRSRPTSSTRVRFTVRVTRGDNSLPPANAVRVWIDGVPFSMSRVAVPGNDDFIQGVVFAFDRVFGAGQEGQHFIYFEYDDGNHKAIWPRRDTAVNGSGDARFFDPQASLAPYSNTYTNSVNFGTLIIGKNYLNEPLVNHKPTLTLPKVDPPSGTENQPFTYEITYRDLDNDAPVDASVVVDGIVHRMTEAPETAGNTYIQGKIFRFVLTLAQTPDAKHSYYFRFRDNWNNMIAYQISPIRREYGEWVTYPPGDENGVPAFEIVGPGISSNHPAELVDAGYSASDQANTAATKYDFFVRYRDLDNQPPRNVKVFISADNGVTWDSGHDLVAAETNTNYVTGVLYHLGQRLNLPVGGPYQYRFSTSDNVQLTDTILIHVGSRSQAVIDGSAHELKGIGGSNLVFGDPNFTNNFNSTLNWLNDVGSLYVWVRNGSTYTRLTQGTQFTLDAARGQITLTSPATGQIYASYFYEIGVGPVVNVNHAPVLSLPTPGDAATNGGSLTPIRGTTTTSFKYSIIYTDQDNQPPTFGAGTTGVNLVVDNNNTIQMTLDPATPSPVDYTRGVKFNATTTLSIGQHIYHFEASDGADTGRYPVQGAQPTDLDGPFVTDPSNLVSPQIFTDRLTGKPISLVPAVGPRSGKVKSDDTFICEVTYRNANGLAPASRIEARLTPIGGGTTLIADMKPIDDLSPAQFIAGVRYQVLLGPNSVPPIPAGTYDVVYGFSGDSTSGTSPLRLTVNGRPILTSPGAQPNPASQAGDIQIGVTYSDINGDLPVRAGARTIKLYIDGTEYVALNPNAIGTDYRLGVLYQWTIAAKTLALGVHNYYFTAQDDLEDANPFQTVTNQFTITAAQLPVLSEPGGDASNNNGTLTPLGGGKGTSYTYSVIYRHGDGVPPVLMELHIDPGTANERVIAMTPVIGTPTQADFISGVKYTATLSDLAFGSHTYNFVATDRLYEAGPPVKFPEHRVVLPVNPVTGFVGPTVNNPPKLSRGIVYVVGTTPPGPPSYGLSASNVLDPLVNGNVNSRFVFQVLYTDADNKAPGAGGFVKVRINNTQEILLKPKPGDALNYAAGVVYSTDMDAPGGIALTAGQKAFHFESSDGVDTATFPVVAGTDITGLTVANVASLGPVSPGVDDGTLAPRVGPLSTSFTYRVVYRNADNTAPSYVKVIIDGTEHLMTKSVPTATNYAAGVEYTFTYRFASGTAHNYRFVSEDAVSPGYLAKYPADGTAISGPTINIATFLPPTFLPAVGTVGQSLTIFSTLQANSVIGAQIAVTLVRPDGSGFNAVATSDPSSANFSYTFVPNETGDWKVRFSWGGTAGTYDPASQEYTFKVVGATLDLQPITDLIALPYIPYTPDPSTTFAISDLDGNAVSVAGLNLITWANLGTSSRYLSLNVDPQFPGIQGGQGFWVKPVASIRINAKGKLWDQTQSYTIPIKAGWNLIGSVYTQPIYLSAIKVAVAGAITSLSSSAVVRPVLYGYNPNTGGYESINVSDGQLRTLRGYWVRATQDCELILSPPGTRSADIGRDVIVKSNALQIAVRTGNRSESDNYVPVTGIEKTRVADYEKPPYVGDYVTVKIISPDKVTLPSETRAAAQGSKVVVFDVETDHKNADVLLQFPNASQLGRKMNITVYDLAANKGRVVANTGSLTYNTGENVAPRRFALIMRPAIANEQLIISGVQLTGNGSRGAGTYSINYNVSAAASMRVQVVSPSGSVIRELDRGRAVTRGVNSQLWDGRDSKGVSVAAGSYTLRLTATDDKGNQANVVVPVLVVR